jgi:hypothetical protein
MIHYLLGGRRSLLVYFVKQVDCPWHVGSRDAARLLLACRGGVPCRWYPIEVYGKPCRPRRRRAEVAKSGERGAYPAVGAQCRSIGERCVGLQGWELLAVDVTELVEKAPPTEWGGGKDAAPLNATFRCSCFIIITACTTTLPASSSLLAKAWVARNRSISWCCSSSSQAAFWRFFMASPASVLLRLNSPLCRYQVLRRLPRLGLLLRPLACGGRSGATGGGIHHSCFRCRSSNIGQGFWREKTGLCATGGRERQVNWVDAGGRSRCPGRCKPGPNLGQG